MKQKLRFAFFAALAFVATTLFGGYLDTHDWASLDSGNWTYENGVLVGAPEEDGGSTACAITVPGRGYLTFRWRVVDKKDETKAFQSCGWDSTYWRSGSSLASFWVYTTSKESKDWMTGKLAHRGFEGEEVVIEFEDYNGYGGKIQMTDIVWESAESTSVTVKFELCGGAFENGESTTMVCTNQYASLPVPVRENCTFLGWTEVECPSTGCEFVSDGAALPLALAKETLYAVWDVPAEEAIDPTGVLRDDDRGNWIDIFYDREVETCWHWRWRKIDEGIISSKGEWAGEQVVFWIYNEPGEVDLVSLGVKGCGTLEFSKLGSNSRSTNSNAEIAVLIDGEEVDVISIEDGWGVQSIAGKYDICDSPLGEHEVRVVARPKNAREPFSLYASMAAIKWTEASGTQTVRFDSRGGSAAGTKTYSIGSVYGSLPQPSRSGATFQGWFTEPDGGEQVVASELVRPSVTNLYARWTASLSTALGGRLTFKSANNAWLGTADVSRQNDGSWSAVTDNVRYGVTNVMSTTVTGRGIISFWWMQGVSSCFVFSDCVMLYAMPSSLTLWMDGKQVAEYDGGNRGLGCNSAWSRVTYAIENEGTHKVEWHYTPGGVRGETMDWNAAVDCVEEWNDPVDSVREFWEVMGVKILERVYVPGAWVQDVSWTPAGEVNDFVTWASALTGGKLQTGGKWQMGGCTWLTGELPTIESYYTKKIKNDPKNYEWLLLRAVTKIAQLGENKNLLAVLKTFGYTPDYQNLGTFLGELDYGRAPLSNALVDSVAKEAIPVLESALADLNQIPDSWEDSIMLSPDVYPVDETTFVDLADVTFARAVVKGALASLAVAQSYDLSLDYAKIETRIVTHDGKKIHPTFKQLVNDHPSFLKSVRNKSRLTEGKKLLREALETAQKADERMLARSTDELHFFEYDSEDEEKIQFARDEIAKGLKALDSTDVLTDDDFKHYKDYRLENLRQSVALGPFFAGKLTRSYLGTEFNEKGWPVLNSFPDVTFGGILPGLKKATVKNWFTAYGVDVGEAMDIAPVVPDSVEPDPVKPDPAKPDSVDPNPEEPDAPDGSWNRLCDDVGDAVDLSSAQVYNGCLYNEDGDIAGTIQVKAAKAGTDRKTGATTSKVAVAIQVAGEKKVTASGVLDVEDGWLSLTTKDGRELEFEIGSSGFAGTFDGYEFDGVRDLFSSKDKAEQTSVNEIANALKAQGALALVWQDEETAGWNILSVTVAAKGKAKVSGTLANGTKVSVSAQMIAGETACCIPVSYSKNGVNLSFGLWIDRDDLGLTVSGLGDDVVVGYASGIEDGAAFYLDVDALCELLGDDTYIDFLPVGMEIAVSGAKWTLPRAGKVVINRKTGEIDESKLGENPSGLKLSFRAKTGAFSGSFKAYTNVKGKPKATTVSVSGIVVDGVGYGVATVKKLGSVSVRVE